MTLQELEASYHRLYHELEQVTTKTQLDAYLAQHIDEYQLDNLLTDYGDTLIRRGNYDFGMELILTAYAHPSSPGVYWDDITLYLRLAQYYIEKGEVETGKQFLLRICTETSDNYEQSIEYRKLSDVWMRYRPLIQDELPVSTQEGCSKEIEEILALSGDELLLELGIHVDELSEHGKCLQKLNQWERIVYDLDTLSSEVNSGGFESWLSYYGARYSQTLKAAAAIGAVFTVSLLEQIRDCFPDRLIPKSQSSIEDLIDTRDLKFEEEDDDYYDRAQPELLKKLEAFVRQNSRHFR